MSKNKKFTFHFLKEGHPNTMESDHENKSFRVFYHQPSVMRLAPIARMETVLWDDMTLANVRRNFPEEAKQLYVRHPKSRLFTPFENETEIDAFLACVMDQKCDHIHIYCDLDRRFRLDRLISRFQMPLDNVSVIGNWIAKFFLMLLLFYVAPGTLMIGLLTWYFVYRPVKQKIEEIKKENKPSAPVPDKPTESSLFGQNVDKIIALGVTNDRSAVIKALIASNGDVGDAVAALVKK